MQVSDSQFWPHIGITPVRCTLYQFNLNIWGGAQTSVVCHDFILLPRLRATAVVQVRKDGGLSAVGGKVRSGWTGV